MRLKLFGTAALETEEGPITGLPARRYPLAILALLATAPHQRLSRSKIVGLLWPEASEESARNRLNTYVHQMRSGLGADVLLSLGDDLRLNTDALRCDVCDFRKALEADDPPTAVDLYDGPYLDGFHLNASVELEMRIDRERERLRRDYRKALETLSDQAKEQGRFRVSADYLHELVEEDPYDSRVVRGLMECLVLAGNRSAALKAAEAHCRLLAEDTGIHPPQSFVEFVSAIEAGVYPKRSHEKVVERPAVQSVAILPFRNLSGSEEAAVFVDGLHGDVLTELSRISSLEVIARSSVLHYREANRPVSKIAEELGTGAVVQGEVQQEGRRIRLRVQLIDAATAKYLWAERYDRELSTEGLFTLQNELTRKIAGALKAELTPVEEGRLARTPTADLDAYRLYVQGRTRLEPRTRSDLKAAADLFRSAIAKDPDYAAAWAGLADALGFLVSYFHVAGGSTLDEALAAAERAIELNPELSEGYAALGLIHMDRKDGPSAVRVLRHAIELGPSSAHAHSMLGWVYSALHRTEESWRFLRKAAQLNPLGPEIQIGLAYGHMFVDYPAETALGHARRAQELAPGYAVAYLMEGSILAASGRPEEAVLALGRGLDRSSPESRRRHLASMTHAYVLAGRADEAQRTLEELAGVDNGFFLAMGYAAIGDADKAFKVLDRVDWTAHHAAHLRHDSALAVVRADPRYGALVRKVNRAWGLLADGSMPDQVDAYDEEASD